MKKIVAMLLVLISILTMISCVDFTDTDTDTDTDENNPSQNIDYQISYSRAILEENSIGSVWVSVIAEITNTGNVDLYLSASSIDLEDEGGNLIDVIDMVSVFPQIISPGEKAYYYEETIANGVDADSTLNVVLHPEVAKSKKQKMGFPVTDVTFSENQFWGIEVTGRIENTSNKNESSIYIVVVLFDSTNAPLAVMFTTESVNAGVKKGFSTINLSLPSEITTSVVASHIAFGYVWQFQF